METNPIRNENNGLDENVDRARRRLLKLAAYAVPAIVTVSFLPVEKVLARPYADEGSSPKTPKSPQSPQTPESPASPQTPETPKTPKATSTPKSTSTPRPTSTPKPTKTESPQTPKTPTVTPTPLASQLSAPKATSSAAGGSNTPEALRLFFQILQQLGFWR